MTRATKRLSTKRPLVPQQNALESATDDPALVIVGQIDVLWGADEAINLRGNGE